MDDQDMAVGIEKEEKEIFAETIPFPLFVPSPGAAGKCLSEHTLVLFLSKPNLEATSRSNCASVESKFWKERQRSD